MAIYLQCREMESGEALVENAIVWDGETPLELPDHELVPQEKAPEGAWIGWTRGKDGAWQKPKPDLAATTTKA